MDIPEGAGYVLAFFGGVAASYIFVRIMSPSIASRIAIGLADEIVNIQVRNTGVAFIDQRTAYREIALPLTNRMFSEAGLM